MRKAIITFTILFLSLNILSQEAAQIKNNPLAEIIEMSGDLEHVDPEVSSENRIEIIEAAKLCLENPDAEIEFQDLYKNVDTVIFHFRDVAENQMYLFVGDQNLQNSRCVALTFREVYENYKLLAKAE